MKKVVIAAQKRIDDFEHTVSWAWTTAYASSRIVTDESRFGDFASCVLPEDIARATQSLQAPYSAWDVRAVPAICSRYGVADLATTTLLVDRFDAIEHQGSKQVH